MDNLTEYCTYTTEENYTAVAITREEFNEAGDLPDDWSDYIWQRAESKEHAVEMHEYRLDAYMAYEAGKTVEDFIQNG
jgi:hypothetical protein